MQITHLTLFFLSVTSIYGHPTKPLDERSTELTWQAWFLVQNNDTDGATRKKVVPKSVFIAPEFDRPCPEGEQRDIAGNCIKLYGLDAEGQLDFLFAKLSQHFDGAKSDEVQNQATPGPAQIHLPLPLRTAGSVDDVVGVVNEDVEANPATEASPPTSTADPSETSTATVTTITERPVRREAPPATQTSTFPTTTWYRTDSPTPTVPTAEEPDSTATTAPADSTTTETGRYTEAETTSSTTLGYGDEQADKPGSEPADEPADQLTVEPTDEPYDERTTDVGPVAFRLPIVGDDDNVRHAANFVRFPGEIFEPYRRPQRDQQRYGHRNRDKNIWRFNPPWRETPDSTLVLFPRVTSGDDVDSYRKLLHEQLSYLLRKNR